ncbi:MAG TPA: hypothetical protein VNR11_15230 [Xanthobacteraceae bacterium]|nr:hypothetical protein [Xanthobacteraceae bacterium]
MQRYLFVATALVLGAGIAAISSPSRAQPYYGGGMMGGYGAYYGMGPGMMGGYGGGYYGMGPGMEYGYGPHGQRYYGRGGQAYRGQRLCWHRTGADRNSGYYGACPK